TLADVNVNAPADQAPTMAPPTRTDDQILPHIRWVPIGKSNCYLDVEKSQSNQIYKIAVDILKHTNFCRAFTASSTIPSIYIKQFWDTVRYDKTAGCYKCQLDEQWFDLTKDTLRDALRITPVNNKAFSSPPSSNALINFVNELCYPKIVRNLSNVVTNDMFQPWRALTTIINLGLTGNTLGFERPRAPVLQILWGIVNQAHLDYADLSLPVSKLASSHQPKPKLAPAKSQGKKRKLVTEISDKPSPVRKSRSGLVSKRHKPISSLRSVYESIAEGIPEKEPRVDDEEADVQRALEESLKSIYDAPRGPLPSIVIRELESGKYQPLLEVRTSIPTGSSGHDESSSLYAKLGLTGNEVESDKDMSGINAGVQGEGHDEQWFDLTKDTLRDALRITPVNNKAFSSPPSSNALINFVNELCYPKLVRNLSNVVTNDMFQPWRALTTIINLGLTGNTSGFERSRAPVLQILLGIVNQAHLDYRKHKFHPRPDSLLHLPNKEPVLGYLKFSAKGTKREVFVMPIPGNLITANIQGEPYYQEYLAKVAKHQRYLADEQGSDPDSPALKSTKATKKSKSSAPKADLRPPVSKLASSHQPEPKLAPAKSQGKKRKLVTEISDKPSPARKSRSGLVSKRHKPISSLRSVDESIAEGIPEKEPRVDDEEADVQRALEESLKSIYDAPRGPLPSIVIRELESGKYQPLPEVQGNGKEVESDKDVSGIDAGVQGEGHC
nr:monodehydroascorbate reductase [Tanacetum cinerariifolium]